MGVVARTLVTWIATPISYLLEKADAVMPTSFFQLLSKI